MRPVFFSSQKRVEGNTQKLENLTKDLYNLATERKCLEIFDADGRIDLLSKRQKDALDMQNGVDTSNADDDSNSSEDDGYATSAILLGSSIAVKNAVRPIKLPEVKRIPPYTSWIFLDRYVMSSQSSHLLLKFNICILNSLWFHAPLLYK